MQELERLAPTSVVGPAGIVGSVVVRRLENVSGAHLIAAGEAHSVSGPCEALFANVGPKVNYRAVVDERLMGPSDVDHVSRIPPSFVRYSAGSLRPTPTRSSA